MQRSTAWQMSRLVARLISCALASVWLASCVPDSGPIGPEFGSLSIITATSGPDPDPDGYNLSVQGAAGQLIGANATFTLPDLTPASYSVELTGVAGNCTVSGGTTRTVPVTAGATAEVSFAVTCAQGGSISITTATSGPEPDADGYSVSLDGAASQPIGTDATLTLSRLTPGDHSVQLAGVASNCTVSGGVARTVAVTAGATTEVSFAVTCTEGGGGGGSISVTTATSGTDPDPDGYSVSVDGAVGQPIGTNASLTLSNLTPGDHSVVLGGVASNCTVSDGTTRTVSVTAGGTAAVSFAVTCAITVEPPTARLTITAEGGGPSVTEGGTLDITVSPGGFITFTFDASRSTPGAGAAITAYEWESNGAPMSSFQTFDFPLDEGEFLITLKVTNSAGLSETASATLRVTE